MVTSEEIADKTPRFLFSSESDNTRHKELEVDLTDQNLGIGLLIPASNIDNFVLFGNKVEDAKGVDLSGGVADAVDRKHEADGFLGIGYLWWVGKIASSTKATSLLSWPDFFPQWAFRARNLLPCSAFGMGPDRWRQFERENVAVTWICRLS